MANVLADSEATFAAKCDAYKLPQAVFQVLTAAGLKTYSSLLFHVASAPNQIDSSKLQTLIQTFPQEHRGGSTPSILNRLLFEAGTFVIAGLKGSLESTEEATVKLSPEERSSRIQAIRTKLGSWPVGGAFEPSHYLIDVCSSMIREQAIKHIPPSRCGSREAEIGSSKKDDQLVKVENSVLKLSARPSPTRVDVSTDLRLYQAFSRRGLALEVAGVCSFEAHESVMRTLFDYTHRHPPPGFTGPGTEQIIRADQELWKQVSSQVKHEFAAVGGQKLVDKALQECASASAVVFHLLPLAKPPQPVKRPWDQVSQDPNAGKGGQKGKKGKKGKGQNQGKDSQPSNRQVPAELKGMSGTRNGIRLCFNFNLAHGCPLECKDVNGNPTCSKGFYLCMKCGGKHSASACES